MMHMDTNHHLLVDTLPRDNERSYKYYKHRLTLFAQWLTDTNRRWDTPDLDVYRHYLLDKRDLAPSTVNSHLSTIRTRYRVLLKDGTLRAAAEELVDDPIQIENLLSRLYSALFAQDILIRHERGTGPTPQRLKAAHLIALLNAPDTNTPVGQRDQALIALLFTTGLREFEVCALQVEDLYHESGRKPALHVPSGRGCAERLIPYDRLVWGRTLVERWLKNAGISKGPVFRGFYRGGRTVRQTGLSVRAVEYILAAYPLDVDDGQIVVRVMDLRRAYARLLYEAGLELEDIMSNLGLKDSNALLDYIGGRDASLDTPSGVDLFDLPDQK